MPAITEFLVMMLLVTDVALLGLSLLDKCIQVVAVQGVLLGILAITVQSGHLTVRVISIALVTVLLKGFVFPVLWRRAVREAGVHRELEPYTGYIVSIFLGILLFGFSVWLGGKLDLDAAPDLAWLVPAALSTLFTGLLLIIARKQALTQSLGYIVMENGIYAFGIATVGEIPALVELGILLDAFVAVLVMGIAIYHINREFDHMDSDRLSSLKG